MNKKPLVTVYIPTYNRLELLKRAVKSVVEQDYTNIELIIVDDGSNDGTIEYLESLEISDRRVRFIVNEVNSGACVSRNKAILAAKGDFVTGLDDDDEFLNNRVSKLLASYSDQYSLVYADDILIKDKNIKKISKPKFASIEQLKFGNCIGNQILTKRERVIEAGLFDEDLSAAQDYDMWFRIVEKYGPAINASCCLQKIFLDGEDRITKLKHKKRGYFRFYNKHKFKMTNAQRKYFLLNTKYVFQEKISLKFFLYLFTVINIKRQLGIFIRRVIMTGSYIS